MGFELILTFLGLMISIYTISSENNKLTFRFKINYFIILFFIISFVIFLFDLILNEFYLKIFFIINLFLLIYIYFFKRISRYCHFIQYLNDELVKGNYSNIILLLNSNFSTIFKSYEISKKHHLLKNNLFREKKFNFFEKLIIKKNQKLFKSLFNLLDEIHSNDQFIHFLLKNNIKLSLKLLDLNYADFPYMFWRKYFKFLSEDNKSRLYVEIKPWNTANKIILKEVFHNSDKIKKLRLLFELQNFVSAKFEKIEKIEIVEKELISSLYEMILQNNKINTQFHLIGDYLKEFLIEDNQDINLKNLEIIFTIYFKIILTNEKFKKEVLFQIGYDLIELLKTNKNENIFLDYYFSSLYIYIEKTTLDKNKTVILFKEIISNYNELERKLFFKKLLKYKKYRKIKEISFEIKEIEIKKLLELFKKELNNNIIR